MSLDPELEGWRQQWQGRDAMPADVKRRVERDIRAKKIGFVCAVAITVLFGGGTLAWAISSRDADIAALAVATWAFIAITWAVSLRIDRGLGHWKPAASTTAAFLEFSIARRVATRRGIIAGAILYAAFSAFMLAWRFQKSASEATATDAWSYLATRWMFWTLTVILAVVAARRWRTLGRELAVLRDLRRGQ